MFGSDTCYDSELELQVPLDGLQPLCRSYRKQARSLLQAS